MSDDVIKVALVNYSESAGGAARATCRLKHALDRCENEIETSLWVTHSGHSVRSANLFEAGIRAKDLLNRHMARLVCRRLRTENGVLHSPALFSTASRLVDEACLFDLVHLHWINSEMLSIADVARIRRPLVWTLHDMWGFCGAEHCAMDERWKAGYLRDNRPSWESGFDLNRWVWRRKIKHWYKPMQVVTPSRWLADCVRQSSLMGDWPTTVIPNAIDVDFWRPLRRDIAREVLGLNSSAPILLFGGFGNAVNEHHKGGDLLVQSMAGVVERYPDIELLVVGDGRIEALDRMSIKVHYQGHIASDILLLLLYNAADLTLVPSRIDNFPNMALESLACGTPVVGFDVCGLPDMITHQVSGFLAKPFDCDDFSAGVIWSLERISQPGDELAINARKLVVERFNYEAVASQYAGVYRSVLAAG